MNRYFGDRKFYKNVMIIAIPIIIQNMITNFVGLLDNIMVGAIGTEQMTGVSIVNQLMFVFNLAIFGAISGPGIFTAQYYGKRDHAGVRATMRFKLIISAIILAVAIIVFRAKGEMLIRLFMTDTQAGLDPEAIFTHAAKYLGVMLIGLIPFTLSNAYSGTLRETEQTRVPMIAGTVATFLNLALNYVLIFGHFGAPKLGVVGAAVATVISRFAEFFIITIWAHTHTNECPYIKGLYKSLSIPTDLVRKILYRGTPLFLNEFMWSVGMSALTQRYSTRGLDVVAAVNISNTIFNLFNVMVISMGSVVAIIIGNLLGASKNDEAVETDRKLITLAVITCALLGFGEFLAAPLFPELYNTEPEIKRLATELLRVNACWLPIHAFLNTSYFTLRSGGKTIITFIFDSVLILTTSFPLAYALSTFTSMTILPLYICVQLADLIKVALGAIFLKKRIWINNLVDD